MIFTADAHAHAGALRHPGGNVHWERILSDILEQIPKNESFSYRVFDCGVMDLGDAVQVTPKTLNILEELVLYAPGAHRTLRSQNLSQDLAGRHRAHAF